jgi:hypothetical protein
MFKAPVIALRSVARAAENLAEKRLALFNM